MPKITQENFPVYLKLIIEACSEQDFKKASLQLHEGFLYLFLNEPCFDLDLNYARFLYVRLHQNIELENTSIRIANYRGHPFFEFDHLTQELIDEFSDSNDAESFLTATSEPSIEYKEPDSDSDVGATASASTADIDSPLTDAALHASEFGSTVLFERATKIVCKDDTGRLIVWELNPEQIRERRENLPDNMCIITQEFSPEDIARFQRMQTHPSISNIILLPDQFGQEFLSGLRRGNFDHLTDYVASRRLPPTYLEYANAEDATSSHDIAGVGEFFGFMPEFSI